MTGIDGVELEFGMFLTCLYRRKGMAAWGVDAMSCRRSTYGGTIDKNRSVLNPKIAYSQYEAFLYALRAAMQLDLGPYLRPRKFDPDG